MENKFGTISSGDPGNKNLRKTAAAYAASAFLCTAAAYIAAAFWLAHAAAIPVARCFAILLPVLFVALLSLLVAGLALSRAWGCLALRRQIAKAAGGLFPRGKIPKEMEKRLASLACQGLKDSLTGLAHRPVFTALAPLYYQNAGPARLCAVIFADMDNLKKINDAYGHAAGDRVLAQAGSVLAAYAAERQGLACRYGGDEFIVFATGFIDESHLSRSLAGLSRRLEKAEGAAPIPAHCSIGAAAAPHGGDLARLIRQADEAMYRVKRCGKGGFYIYQPPSGQAAPPV